MKSIRNVLRMLRHGDFDSQLAVLGRPAPDLRTRYGARTDVIGPRVRWTKDKVIAQATAWSSVRAGAVEAADRCVRTRRFVTLYGWSITFVSALIAFTSYIVFPTSVVGDVLAAISLVGFVVTFIAIRIIDRWLKQIEILNGQAYDIFARIESVVRQRYAEYRFYSMPFGAT